MAPPRGPGEAFGAPATGGRAFAFGEPLRLPGRRSRGERVVLIPIRNPFQAKYKHAQGESGIKAQKE